MHRKRSVMRTLKQRYQLWMFSCILIVSAPSCQNTQWKSGQWHILLQPLGNYPQSMLPVVQQELQDFFQVKVALASPTALPASFVNLEKGKRYQADSIIRWLKTLHPSKNALVVGLTSDKIFITKRDKLGRVKPPADKYKVWGIFGLGYLPGRSCVISDGFMKTKDKVKYRHRLLTVLKHEIGHNLGLPHCPEPACIMNDANETIATVDRSGYRFCHNCSARAALNTPKK